MNKEIYLKELIEIEKSDIFITDSIDKLDVEIYHNCIGFGIPDELDSAITSSEILEFLQRIKANRQHQLANSKTTINLIYYLWFDEMAGELRFNLINSNHKSLPFGGKFNIIDSEELIVENFISSNYLNGIPNNEMETVKTLQEFEEMEDFFFEFNVYKEDLIQ